MGQDLLVVEHLKKTVLQLGGKAFDFFSSEMFNSQQEEDSKILQLILNLSNIKTRESVCSSHQC